MTRLVLPRWAGTLAFKAGVFITVMCCALAALLGVLVHVSVTDQTVGQARDLALSRLRTATTQYEAGDSLVHGAGVDSADLPVALRRLAAGGERGTMVGRHRGRPTMWAAGPADDDRVLAVAVDYSQGAGTIAGLDRAIFWSSGLAIGATLLVGAFAVTRVTRRLHGTAQVARRISAGDLDARVDDPRTKDANLPQDEVAAVAAALDTMASSLQGKLLTEQRFTADVAHELRTPLTGLHAAAELLPPGRPTELVRDRVAALRTLTEDLLEISRLDTRREKVELDTERLGALAERVVRGPGAGVRSSSCGTSGWRRTGGGWSGCWGILSRTRIGMGGGGRGDRGGGGGDCAGSRGRVSGVPRGAWAAAVPNGGRGYGAWVGADHRARTGGGVGGAVGVLQRG